MCPNNKVTIKGCLVDIYKYIFLIFKQYYTHFYTLFHPYLFSHMFSNNKIHIFKLIYQTPPNNLNSIFVNVTVNVCVTQRQDLI